jgi:glycosyltransferase involved in cell wall biosynthesis
MISTDRKIFDGKSAVRARQIGYAEGWDEVHIIVFEARSKEHGASEMGDEQLSRNCWAYSTRSRFKFRYPHDAIRLGGSIIKDDSITDITCQDPFLTAMAGASLAERFSIPLEIQIHADIGSPYYAHDLSGRIRKMMAKRYLPQADKVRVVSERIKRYLVDQIKIDEAIIEVRPIAVDAEWMKNAPVIIDIRRKYPQFDKIALMASRLEPEKDIGSAIKAWTEVVKKLPKAGLVIVGEGSVISDLRSLISRCGLRDSVMIEPWADRATLASYYKTADLFLNVSLFEGYGMTLVEAQAAGCRIVSTDVGVAREVGAKITEHGSSAIAEAVIQSFNGREEMP